MRSTMADDNSGSDSGGGSRWLPILVGLMAVLGIGWWLVGNDDASGDETAEGAEAGEDAAAQSSGKLPGVLRSSPFTQEKASVAGTISDEQGKPIAGATVCAWARGNQLGSAQTRFPTCVTSEKDGHYRIDDLYPVEHTVSASAPSFVPNEYAKRLERGQERKRIYLRPGGLVEGIDIALESGGVAIRGVVMDVSGGEVEGAFVSSGGGGWWWRSTGSSVAFTDAEGKFELWVEPGETSVNARAEGYATGRQSGAAPGHAFEVYLTPESVIVGQVVMAGTSEPVAGVKVGRSQWRFGNNEASGVTDEEGHFRIDGLEPGSYKLTAFAPELYGLANQTVHLGLGQTSDPIVIEVHEAYAIEGQVLIGGEEPCGEATVRVKDHETDQQGGDQADDEGNVVIESVLPGTYNVEVFCQGTVAAETYGKIEIKDESITGQVWEVTEGYAMRGGVFDANGEPVEDARISATMVGGAEARAKASNAWGGSTTADGSFEVAGLKSGTYEIHVNSDLPDPKDPVEVEVEGADVNGIRIELPAVGAIAGTVRDQNGAPVASATVRTEGGTRWQWKNVSTADDGTYKLEDVEVGEKRVVASRGWSNEMRAPGTSDDDVQGQKVNVEAGKTVQADLVVESESGKITGRVLDEQGNPVSDAFIEAERESDSATSRAGSAARRVRWSWRGFNSKPVLTDQDGRFEVDELADGTYSVRAHRKGGGDTITDGVAVGSDIELVLEATGELSGVVVYAGGGHPEKFQVSLSDREAGYSQSDGFFRSKGAWSLTQLPAGKFEITVTAARGSAKQEVSLEEGESKGEIRIELTPKVTVTGTVVDLESGEPVPGMRVSVAAGRGFNLGQVESDERKEITDEAGRFEVERAATGEVQLAIIPKTWGRGSDYSFTFRPMTLPPEPEVQDLGVVKIAKTRMEQNERPGDLGFELKEWDPTAEHGERKHEVALVRPDGPAADSGLKPGDIITEIDGTSVVGEDHYLYYTLSRVAPGTKLSITVESGTKATIVAQKPL